MKVLLARPHDFVVNDMTRWVRDLGLEPLRLSAVSELSQTPPTEVAGIVISTAVTSSVAATFGEVLDAARVAHASAPLVIVSLSSLASTRAGFTAELARHRLALHACDEPAAWGRAGEALFLSPGDLKPPRVELATAAARRHFRRGAPTP